MDLMDKILENGFENIQYSIIKGDVLSMLAYGNVNHRPYHDVDILISRAQLKELHIILCS